MLRIMEEEIADAGGIECWAFNPQSCAIAVKRNWYEVLCHEHIGVCPEIGEHQSTWSGERLEAVEIVMCLCMRVCALWPLETHAEVAYHCSCVCLTMLDQREHSVDRCNAQMLHTANLPSPDTN